MKRLIKKFLSPVQAAFLVDIQRLQIEDSHSPITRKRISEKTGYNENYVSKIMADIRKIYPKIYGQIIFDERVNGTNRYRLDPRCVCTTKCTSRLLILLHERCHERSYHDRGTFKTLLLQDEKFKNFFQEEKKKWDKPEELFEERVKWAVNAHYILLPPDEVDHLIPTNRISFEMGYLENLTSGIGVAELEENKTLNGKVKSSFSKWNILVHK